MMLVIILFQNQIIVSDYTHLLLLPYQGADVTETVLRVRRSPSGKHEKDEPKIIAFFAVSSLPEYCPIFLRLPSVTGVTSHISSSI